MTYRRHWLACALLLLALGSSALLIRAQTGGQFCVRAFDDRDGDGIWAGADNEPLLTRDVVVNLLNADSVVVASGLLESSPTAAEGILCFQFLPSGQYTAIISSAERTATTPANVVATVSETGEPVLVEYGARLEEAERVPAVAGDMPGTDEPSDQNVRIVVSLIGAVIVMLGILLLGGLLYAFALRGSSPPRTAPISQDTPTSRVQ
jgi:hypothetical protein